MQDGYSQDDLLEVVSCPKGVVLGLRVQSKALKESFDKVLDTAQKFLDGNVEPFPLQMTEDLWYLTTPKRYRLPAENRSQEGPIAILDEYGNLLGVSPDTDCLIDKTPKDVMGRMVGENAHDNDMARCMDAAVKAYNGTASEVDYRIPNGNTNIINSCTFTPYQGTSSESPFLLSELSHGYAKAGHS